jgi:low affinity Fe/Cu permease
MFHDLLQLLRSSGQAPAAGCGRICSHLPYLTTPIRTQQEGLPVSRRIDHITDVLGHPLAVVIAAASVLAWGLVRPFVHFSDRWQVSVQTATALVTFLMIFCVQHTQSKDDVAMQAKLDELIRAVGPARNDLIGIERSDRGTIQETRTIS